MFHIVFFILVTINLIMMAINYATYQESGDKYNLGICVFNLCTSVFCTFQWFLAYGGK